MKRRILLAEDDPSVVKVTKLRLEHEGFEVVVAMDGEVALALAEANGIDVILLDVRMPKLDGFAVCQRLKSAPHTARIPVIIFTGSSAQWAELVDRCIELGVADCLKKPFRSAELMEKIRHALGEEGKAHG